MRHLAVLLLAALGAQGPIPTLDVPPAASSGDQVVVRASGCAEAPHVDVARQLDDVVVRQVFEVDEGGGTWSTTFAVGQYDVELLDTVCAGHRFGRRVIDVESPLMVPPPWGDPPYGQVYGTDCPPDTAVTVSLVGARGRIDLTPPVDAEGDWWIDVPAEAGPGTVEVGATCGGLTYPPLHLAIVGPPEAPPAPPGAPVAPSSAPPALPVPTAARFTG